ncbi:UNVERIFIED_CONTAM: hypothetical protein Slati_4400200 [Sesamum latifolium]|uniref:Retroviral polymerase SH3-like domain-containing protein n=1 Tax=Sesamum latifolium TaxID=2727402 RepID=A0AAW2SP64_9LAMI
MTKKPFVRQSALASGLLDLIHTDVCGPLNTPTRGGYSYFITFTDDHSRYGYVYLMRVTLLRWQPSCLTWRYLRWCPRHYMRYGMASLHPKYLRVWGSPAYVKRLVEDKLDSRSSFCKFVGYLKKTAGYYFYDPFEQKNDATSFEPMVSTDSVPVLRWSTRESRPPDRYGFLGLTSQLDNDPRTYGEAMSDIDSDKWLEAMRSEMDSMGSIKLEPRRPT